MRENLAGKSGRKAFTTVATAEQSVRRRRTTTQARALEVASK
jgi:hypothetical protein